MTAITNSLQEHNSTCWHVPSMNFTHIFSFIFHLLSHWLVRENRQSSSVWHHHPQGQRWLGLPLTPQNTLKECRGRTSIKLEKDSILLQTLTNTVSCGAFAIILRKIWKKKSVRKKRKKEMKNVDLHRNITTAFSVVIARFWTWV